MTKFSMAIKSKSARALMHEESRGFDRKSFSSSVHVLQSLCNATAGVFIMKGDRKVMLTAINHFGNPASPVSHYISNKFSCVFAAVSGEAQSQTNETAAASNFGSAGRLVSWVFCTAQAKKKPVFVCTTVRRRLAD